MADALQSQRRRERAQRIITLFPRIMNSIALSKIHTPRRGRPDLTFNQYQALVLVHALGECSVNDLARRLRVAQSTTSQLVDRLVRARLVRRVTTAGDRRRVSVSLTTTGKTMMDKRTVSLRAAYERILNLLTEPEQQAFEDAFETFHRIARKVEEALGQGAP